MVRPDPDGRGQGKGGGQGGGRGQLKVIPGSEVECFLAGYMTTKNMLSLHSELKIQIVGCGDGAVAHCTDRAPMAYGQVPTHVSTGPSTNTTGQRGWVTGVFLAAIELILV